MQLQEEKRDLRVVICIINICKKGFEGCYFFFRNKGFIFILILLPWTKKWVPIRMKLFKKKNSVGKMASILTGSESFFFLKRERLRLKGKKLNSSCFLDQVICIMVFKSLLNWKGENFPLLSIHMPLSLLYNRALLRGSNI